MEFYFKDGCYEVKDKDDIIEFQNLIYNKLKNDLYDKSTNFEVFKLLNDKIDEELKISTFGEKEEYVNQENYENRNKNAVKFFILYFCYGNALMRLYVDYCQTDDFIFDSIKNAEEIFINIKGMLNEVELSIKDNLLINFKTKKQIYGATMITLSLFERNIIENIKRCALKEEVKILNKMIEDKQIEIEEKYLKYFKIAKEVYINNKIIKIFEDVDDIKYNITEMIKKYNELKSDVKKDLDKLVNDKSYTLGALLNNIYAKRNLDSDLLTLLKCMFDAKELNLRNDIMHCNTYKPYDPFDFPITMIFFHLLILISYEILII